MTIAVVDYCAGNLGSVVKALIAAGATPHVVASITSIRNPSGIVIPGVGHFGAMQSIDDGERRAIRAEVERGTPLLGICLGMQWLFDGSDEAPDQEGLSLLAGRCRRLTARAVKVPHVGWNSLERTRRTSRLLEGLATGVAVYFTHSYAMAATDDAVALTTHGDPFASVVERGHIFGTQFHPEKSGEDGLRVLRNFIAVSRIGRGRC